jgi:hypothetical protein
LPAAAGAPADARGSDGGDAAEADDAPPPPPPLPADCCDDASVPLPSASATVSSDTTERTNFVTPADELTPADGAGAAAEDGSADGAGADGAGADGAGADGAGADGAGADNGSAEGAGAEVGGEDGAGGAGAAAGALPTRADANNELPPSALPALGFSTPKGSSKSSIAWASNAKSARDNMLQRQTRRAGVGRDTRHRRRLAPRTGSARAQAKPSPLSFHQTSQEASTARH